MPYRLLALSIPLVAALPAVVGALATTAPPSQLLPSTSPAATATTPSPTPSPTRPAPATEPAREVVDPGPDSWVVLGGGALVLVAGVGGAVVVARRVRRADPAGSEDEDDRDPDSSEPGAEGHELSDVGLGDDPHPDDTSTDADDPVPVDTDDHDVDPVTADAVERTDTDHQDVDPVTADRGPEPVRGRTGADRRTAIPAPTRPLVGPRPAGGLSRNKRKKR